MDDMDCIRNEILRDLNLLLEKCGEPTFALITLSSQTVKGGQSDYFKSDLLIYLRRVLGDDERWHR